MSSTELDMPLTPSADQIRRREFVSVRRGYDPDQVRTYLTQVGDQVEKLEEQVRVADAQTAEALQAKAEAQAAAKAATQAAAEAGQLEAPPAPAREDIYADLSERMADMLRTAERHAQDVRKEADAECAKMVAEARAAADKIRIDSQGKAEELRQEADEVLSDARREAEQMLSGLHVKRDALVAELEEMRDRLLSMAQSIGSVSEHESQVLGLELPEVAPGSSSKADAGTSVTFSDPQFAELWNDPDPSTDVPAPKLEDAEPEDPSPI